MKYPILQLPEDKIEEFKASLEIAGFSFEERPHQVFLARKKGIVVNSSVFAFSYQQLDSAFLQN